MMQQFMPGSAAESAFETRAFWLGFAACSPLIVGVGLVLNTLLLHLFLMMLGGAKRGMAATLRALSYSYTAMLAGVVPGCGSLIGALWYLYLIVTGLAKAHGISYGKAAVAVILPVVLCGVCFVILMFGAFGALMSSGALPGIAP
jgi:hypothetical protein